MTVLRQWAADAEVAHEEGVRPGELLVTLPGEHRLRTLVSVLVGSHTLSVSAFVVRRADEDPEAVMRWLLRRNARLRGVAFALDTSDDVYLVGRLPIAAVTPESLDDLFGSLLETADQAFDELLRLGFPSSIRREAAWRRARGLDDANLRPFRDLVEDDTPAAHPGDVTGDR